MTKTATAQRQRTPEPLNRKLDSFILDAALAALTEHGYAAMNMDDVAARGEM
jgi:AcrR family transcriptional regulator